MPFLPRFTLVYLALSLFTHLSKPMSAKANQISTQYDDGSSLFTWTGIWNVITPSTPCHTCDYQPDPSQMFDQTWHDGGTEGPTGGSIKFNGTEIYIYGADTVGEGSVSFFLDGGSAVVHTSEATSGWIYNETFFKATDLSPDEVHEVVFTLSGIAVLDSAVVVNIAQTTVVSSTSSPKPTSTSPPSTTTALTGKFTAIQSSSGLQTSKHSSSQSFSTSSVLSSDITVNSQSSSLTVSDSTNIPSPTVVSSSEGSKSTRSAASQNSHRNVNTAVICGVSGGILAILVSVVLLYRNRKKRNLQAEEKDSHNNQNSDEIVSKLTSQSSANMHDEVDQAVERRETRSVIDIRRFSNFTPQEMLAEYRRMQLLRAQDFNDNFSTGTRSEELPPAYYDGRRDTGTSTTLEPDLTL